MTKPHTSGWAVGGGAMLVVGFVLWAIGMLGLVTSAANPELPFLAATPLIVGGTILLASERWFGASRPTR